MGTFAHEDTGYSSSTSSASLTVTLSNAVAAGDLLVLWVQSGGAGVANTSVRDNAGNVWTNAYNGQLWYCAAALVSPNGVTITAAVTANAVYQMIADRFTPSGPVVFNGFAISGSAGTLGLDYNAAGCGDLGTVSAGALAWGAFSVSSASGDQSYTPGFQTDTTSPADVIGSQFNGANGTGLSMYVTGCANEDATLTWYGTGTGAIGSSGSMWFTIAPPPPPLFTHQDSAIAQATANVTVITATLTKPVNAGDLLICAAKSPDGSMTSANLSDSAGNTWTVAGGGNYLYLAYCLASNPAPGGLTLTVTTQNVSHHGVVIDRFTPATGYTAEFSAFSDNLTLSSFTTGLNYQYGNNPPRNHHQRPRRRPRLHRILRTHRRSRHRLQRRLPRRHRRRPRRHRLPGHPAQRRRRILRVRPLHQPRPDSRHAVVRHRHQHRRMGSPGNLHRRPRLQQPTDGEPPLTAGRGRSFSGL